MKKEKVFILLMGCLLASCITYYFESPVPIDARNRKSMPGTIRGEWNTDEGKLIINKTQWISISTDTNGVTSKKVEYELSDSLILRSFKKYFFFNQLEENGFWSPYFGFKSNGQFLIKSLGEKDSLILVKELNILPDSVSESGLFFYQPIDKIAIKKLIDTGGFCDTLFVFDLKRRTMQ